MSALLESERKTLKARVFLAFVYGLLTLGALTMVYPFAVMLAASLSSSYDYTRHSPVIRGFFDRNDRFMRAIATRFKTFPREVYPDAPAHWTGWSQVAKDRAGVARFVTDEWTRHGIAGTRANRAANLDRLRAQSRAARDALARTPMCETTCAYDPRDVARFVERKYGTLDRLNAAWPVPHTSFFDISFTAESKLTPGQRMAGEKFATWLELKQWYVDEAIRRDDYLARTLPHPIADHAAEIRAALLVQFVDHGWRDFLEGCLANYRLVGDYLFVRGRAFVNTVLLVLLAVLVSLTVNPLAAYALSRFRLKATERILLFLLATMAFPAAVTAIPGFLLIRDLGLLNTFAALVLPTAASGMSIFILKGFFDALPRELYEAAAIDGASEWTVFRRITLPMTTPILAVNALNSFIHAYSSWEWAFLVCQKESHWTLAVWMYQMSQTLANQPWCVMAGFVVVSLPTAAVFLLCQKVILRGIVLPSMK
ncbi:MAG: carbohydrate ABC transporter permease [Kiritimatiellia bacterium]